MVELLPSDLILGDLSFQKSSRVMHEVRKFLFDKPYLFCICMDDGIHSCIPQVEMMGILEPCHSSLVGDHHDGTHTTHKILQFRYYWPTIFKVSHEYAQTCDQCQCQGNILQRHELLMTPMLELELFNV